MVFRDTLEMLTNHRQTVVSKTWAGSVLLAAVNNNNKLYSIRHVEYKLTVCCR